VYYCISIIFVDQCQFVFERDDIFSKFSQYIVSTDFDLLDVVLLFECQASMLSTPDGPFINLARLDMSKYAAKPSLAKALFEYIFHHENDIRNVRLWFSLQCLRFFYSFMFSSLDKLLTT